MGTVIRKYEEKDLCAMIEIWNEIVEEGNAFPQEEFLTLESGAVFFAEQTYTGVAVDAETEKIYGLYILHPNNVGRCGHMREFFEKTEWYNLIPRFDNRAYFVPANNVYYSYASNENNTEIVVYFYSFTDESVAQKANTKFYGGIKTGTVGNLVPNGSYTCQWFDPISVEYSEKCEFTATKLGTYYIGNKPQATDMILYIKSADKSLINKNQTFINRK